MIQRIQSLFLFLIDIVLVVLLFVPFMGATDTLADVPAFEVTLLDFPMALAGQAVICILAGAAIATFKNRRLQMRICLAGMILSVVYSCALSAIPMMLNTAAPGALHYVSMIGTWISLANFLLFLLAWKFIKKDEELVKSMDRIR